MELDLRPREIRLPGDIVLRCKPMTLGALQKWLIAGPKQGATDVLSNPAITDAAVAILKESLVEMSGFTVRQPDGTSRPGTLEDLVAGGGLAGAVLLIRAANESFKSSGLSETDLGNLLAAPIAGPAAAAAKTAQAAGAQAAGAQAAGAQATGAQATGA